MAMNETDFLRACKKIEFLLFDCDGVLTDGRIVLGGKGMDLKFFSTKDGMGISLWRKIGLGCGCITGRTSEALQRRSDELTFDELHQGVPDKRQVLEEIRHRRHLQVSHIAYVGDDLNDLVVLGRVGLFFAPADAHPEVKKRADRVLLMDGGKGCVREVVDTILQSKGSMEKIIADLID